MFNDVFLQMKILEINDNDEVKAFRWLFTPIKELNDRTPFEVVSDGGRDRILQILEEISGH